MIWNRRHCSLVVGGLGVERLRLHPTVDASYSCIDGYKSSGLKGQEAKKCVDDRSLYIPDEMAISRLKLEEKRCGSEPHHWCKRVFLGWRTRKTTVSATEVRQIPDPHLCLAEGSYVVFAQNGVRLYLCIFIALDATFALGVEVPLWCRVLIDPNQGFISFSRCQCIPQQCSTSWRNRTRSAI